MAASALPFEAILIIGGIGLVLLGAGLREGYRAFSLRRMAPTPIAELTGDAGTVVVAGVARTGDETVRAPFTDVSCLAYEWRVVALRTVRGFDGSISSRMSQIASGQDGAPFYVEDDTGRVLVDPRGADLRFAEEFIDDPASDPTGEGDLLYPRSIDLSGQTRARQFYEGRLDDGEPVVVQGRVSDSGDVDLRAGQVGVRIAGGHTLVSDSKPEAAYRKALRAAVFSSVLGLLALGVLAVLL